jgi:hypothetical protein
MNASSTNPERWKTLVLVLTLINTILVAAISALQLDATVHANQANRDTQYYAIQVAVGLAYSGARSDYDMGTYAAYLDNHVAALVAGNTAGILQDSGDQQGYEKIILEANVFQAQADMAASLSVLVTDPAYGYAPGQGPNYNAYMTDLLTSSNEMLQEQKDAAKDYHHWNDKADSYISVLTVSAITFFLLGVAQIVRPAIRLLFSIFAGGGMCIAVLWTLILLVL